MIPNRKNIFGRDPEYTRFGVPAVALLFMLAAIVPGVVALEEAYFYDSQWGGPQFDSPCGIAVSSSNVYVADKNNHRIQDFRLDGTFLTEFDDTSDGMRLAGPYGVAVDASGNVYVANTERDYIQKYYSDGTPDRQWGERGTGEGQFISPYGVAVDAAGNVYVVDHYNHRIQKFTSTGGYLAKWGKNGGDGSSGSGAGEFNYPQGVAVDSVGNVYVADSDNHRIQKFTSTGGYLAKWGKNGGDGSSGYGDGEFNHPLGVAVDSVGNIYVADTGNDRIQKFYPDGTFFWKRGMVIGGTGDGQFDGPVGIAVDSSGNVYVSDNNNNRIQKFTPQGEYSSKWGSKGDGSGQLNYPSDVAVSADGSILVADTMDNLVPKFNPAGIFESCDGFEMLGGPYGVAAAAETSHVYVADTFNDRIIVFLTANSPNYNDAQWGTEGDGEGQFANPCGVATYGDYSSRLIYVADTDNNRIQKFLHIGGDNTATYIGEWGSEGSGESQFIHPIGIAVDASGNIYVADRGNHRIQKFSWWGGEFLRQWGSYGTENGKFSFPSDVTVDGAGNVYVADTGNNRIQKFSPTGIYIAKWGSFGTGNGQFRSPAGIAVNDSGVVYVADTGNNRIQTFHRSLDYGIGVFRPSAANNWILDRFRDGTIDLRDHYGTSTDIPLFVVYLSPYVVDRVIFRSGQWIVDYGTDGTIDERTQFGMAGDIPLIGHMIWGSQCDRAVFRKGQWIFDYQMDGTVDKRDMFGTSGDIPLIGDFNGDAVTDRAVFRSSAYDNWIIDYSMDGTVDVRNHYGIAGDIPVVGFFNENPSYDRAVFRKGWWIIDDAMDGSVDSRVYFGQNGDLPLVWH